MAAIETQASPMLVVRALIRERIETGDGRELADIADLLVEEGLPDECVAALLRYALLDIAQSINRKARERTTGSAGNRSPKWDAVRDLVSSHPDVFQTSWPTEHGLKMLGDFTKADAVWTHRWYVKQAKGLATQAEKFARLAKALPADAMAHSLDRSKVEAIFDA